MSYQFPQDIEERVKVRIGDGGRQTEDEIFRQAMDALDKLEQDQLIRWDDHNRLAQQQSQQGLSKPLDDKAVLARLRHRLARAGILD